MRPPDPENIRLRTRALPGLFIILVLCASGSSGALAETVTIEATRDATIIEDPDGAFANGAGPVMFIGRTSSAGVRRALVMFDLNQALPDHAIVESVALTLTMTPSNPEPRILSVHRVMEDWGEGSSVASGGGGALSGPGDATWIHTFWDTDFWTVPGGWFAARPSGQREVSVPGSYTWESTRRLVLDVQRWAVAPHRNFGWILVGDESVPQTAKSFATRENPDPMLRPVLEITYRLPRDRARR